HYAVDTLGIELARHLDNYEKELQQRSECFNRTLNGEDCGALLRYLHFKKNEHVYCFAISAASHRNLDFTRYMGNLVDRYYPDATLFFTNSHYVILSPSRNYLKDFAEHLYNKHGLIIGIGSARPITQIDDSY